MVKLSSIIEGIEFQGDESQSYLDLKTGEVVLITDEQINAAERDDEISEQAEWFKEVVAIAKHFLENPDQYLELPSKYDLNEYQIMEEFVYSIPVEVQKEKLLRLIKGKGAFSRFRQGVERFMLLDSWYKYRDTEFEKFAQEWCEENGISYDKD